MLLLSLLMITQTGLAQPVINFQNQNVDPKGKVIKHWNYGLELLTPQEKTSGPNQVWDFSTILLTNSSISKTEPLDSLHLPILFRDSFTRANLLVTENSPNTIWNCFLATKAICNRIDGSPILETFYEQKEDGLYFWGAVERSNCDGDPAFPLVVLMDTSLKVISYPFTYLDSLSVDPEGKEYLTKNFKVEFTFDTIDCDNKTMIKADAYGRLITPFGVFDNALRVRSTIAQPVFWAEVIYNWYVPGIRGPVMTIGEVPLAQIYYVSINEYPNEPSTCVSTNMTCIENPDALICEDFEPYSLGDISPQSPVFIPWDLAEFSALNARISQDFAAEGKQSLKIAKDGDGNDQLVLLGNQTQGCYSLSWKMYLPNGRSGYFNIQNSEIPGNQWNNQMYFHASGKGYLVEFYVSKNDTIVEFSFPSNRWVEFKQEFNLNANTFKLFIDGKEIYQGEYLGNLGAVNFWAFNDQSLMYIDDFSLVALNDRVTGTENRRFENHTLSIAPNPSNGQVYINLPNVHEAGQLKITDLKGQVVFQMNLPKDQLKVELNPNLPAGMYVVTAQYGHNCWRGKLVFTN